jgi:hypothetical protein
MNVIVKFHAGVHERSGCHRNTEDHKAWCMVAATIEALDMGHGTLAGL